MVEAGGIEPPSAKASPQLLRACSVYDFSPPQLPTDRPSRRPAATFSFSPRDPVAQTQGQPAVVASLYLAGVGRETSRQLSREGQLIIGFCVLFPG